MSPVFALAKELQPTAASATRSGSTGSKNTSLRTKLHLMWSQNGTMQAKAFGGSTQAMKDIMSLTMTPVFAPAGELQPTTTSATAASRQAERKQTENIGFIKE